MTETVDRSIEPSSARTSSAEPSSAEPSSIETSAVGAARGSAGVDDAANEVPSEVAARTAEMRQVLDRKRARDARLNWLAPLITFGLIIGVWYFISYVRMDEVRRRTALPPPHQVLTDGFLVWHDRKGIRPILESLLVTGRVALIGLAISVVLGIVVAIVMNTAKWAEKSIFPYAVVLQVTPILALVPLLRNWFGFGIASRVVVCVLIAIFPVITNTLFGLQSAQQRHHDLFALHGVSSLTRLTKLELPGAMPAIFTGLRIAAGGCVIGAVVGDFFFRQGAIGVGRLLDNYQKDTRIPELITATICACIFGIVIFAFVGWLSNRMLRSWHDSAGADT